MNRIKAVLMTSDGLRHRYAANILNDSLNLVGIIPESKASLTAHLQNSSEQDEVVKKHFLLRDIAETKYFGNVPNFPDNVDLLPVEHGKSNSIEVYKWVKSKLPDVVILYGSSIIKPPLLEYYDKRIINIHLGLSPYYRGSGTNFWPLVDGLPECVGATIHLATLKVDAGDILSQVRPEKILPTDRAHDLGTKTIIAGFKKMCDIVPAYLDGDIQPSPQDLTKGKLCRRKDFTPESVVKMWKNFSEGMMIKYINDKKYRNSFFPIIN